jgi:predicted RNA methylase
MFSKDFFPTPENVLDMILSNVNLENKVILEPSAGSGYIIEYALKKGAKEVLCCEDHEDLFKICASKGKLIARDFFWVKKEEVSHIDVIIMNPPFSKDEQHIVHAFEVAPDGCEILALCNFSTYDNSFSRSRKNLKEIVDNNGTITNLGNVFSTAERKTDVNIGFIHLFKPKGSSDNEFNDYFDFNEECEHQENGIIQFNEVRNIVNRYVEAVKRFDSIKQTTDSINSLIDPINKGEYLVFGAFMKNRSSDLTPINRETFKKELQKSAWKSIFARMNMYKYVTNSVLSDINKFVEQQTNVPFTMKNIYLMLEIIVGTQGSRMERVITEAFDNITQHYDENRFALEGWKTNSEYMVNRRFILPYIVEPSFRGDKMRSTYSSRNNYMDDLHKALCYVTGKPFEDSESFSSFLYIDRDFATWYDWSFFRFKGHKKGTIHVEFKDEKVWLEFNRIACKAKGFMLATNYKSNFRAKPQDVDLFTFAESA